MRLKSRARRGFLALFLQLVLAVALATQTPADDLPAAAKEATSKGLAAAGQKEWKIALRYLEEARKAAPHSPITLYNLALAEAQIPGRELRAVACFEAYLLAAPETDKAASIRSQIAKLELKTEADAGQIIDMAKQVASNYSAGSYEANSAQESIAILQAHAGDVDAALATARQLLSNNSNVSLIPDIVEALAVGGHFDEAKSLAGQIGDAADRSSAFWRILAEQAKRGLLNDARSTLSQISYPQFVRLALSGLVEAEAKAGEMDQARQRLIRLDEMAKGMSTKDAHEKSQRNSVLDEVGQSHLLANDWRGAKAILALVFNEKGYAYHDRLEGAISQKMNALRDDKLKVGDWAGAEAIVDAETPMETRVLSYASIARQPELKNNRELLASLANKTQTLFAASKAATEKFFVAIAAAQIAG
ncbi:MAG: hypothetical protein M3R59_10225, partial [Verrucomicrobiota bacterium]|nr:hypothetical protein [Verrucomicrobiota bacterium]